MQVGLSEEPPKWYCQFFIGTPRQNTYFLLVILFLIEKIGKVKNLKYCTIKIEKAESLSNKLAGFGFFEDYIWYQEYVNNFYKKISEKITLKFRKEEKISEAKFFAPETILVFLYLTENN